ncbi:hypothetical protein JJQ03_23975 [Enterobacter hormaechei]|uniref:hypothetical protein n=1 Tax=Enterobacter hormaechei TaxID=158836 RepID=UPI001A3EC60F|nr:hypothetical protein [Enterobacter hormaechei]
MNNESAPSIETQLAAAEDALSQWEEHDLNRSDGSMRQDLIHENKVRSYAVRLLTYLPYLKRNNFFRPPKRPI